MNDDPERTEHENRVRYLYEVARWYAEDWCADSTLVNWRRYRFAKTRYETVKAEGVRRFGVTRNRREQG
jgi:hypothetical protein